MVIVMFCFRQTPHIRWLVLLAMVPAIGCCATAKTPGAGFAGSGPLRPAPAVAATDLLKPRDATVIYKVTEGPDVGHDRALIVATDVQGWVATLTDWNQVKMSVTDTGAVLTHFDVDFASKVRVVYQPPITVAPARLVMGAPFEGESNVEIRNLHDGSLRTMGKCLYRVELIGRQLVQTPAGRFDAFIVRTRRHMQLTLADAIVTSIDAYVPERAQVAHRLDKQVRFLGLLPTRSVREMRLRGQ